MRCLSSALLLMVAGGCGLPGQPGAAAGEALAGEAVAGARTPGTGTAATPDATAIMHRVARNLETAVDERRLYVYRQHVRARLLRTNGERAREEKREYRALPGPERTEKELVKLEGEYWKNKKEVVRYDSLEFEKGGLDIDGVVIKELVKELLDSGEARDGVENGMFPLRRHELKRYRFAYLGSTEVGGRPAHHIRFEPAPKTERCFKSSEEDSCVGRWKGEAWVDAAELQPVRLVSDSTFRMPGAVKFILGTNAEQVGFAITYARVAPGVWFPVSYGTEFRVDLLFRYKRVITMAMESKDFQRTGASSEIRYELPPPGASTPQSGLPTKPQPTAPQPAEPQPTVPSPTPPSPTPQPST